MLIWLQGLTETHLRQVGETITRLSNQAWQPRLWDGSAKHTLSLYRLFCNLCAWTRKDNVTSIWHSSHLKSHMMDGCEGLVLFCFVFALVLQIFSELSCSALTLWDQVLPVAATAPRSCNLREVVSPVHESVFQLVPAFCLLPCHPL